MNHIDILLTSWGQLDVIRTLEIFKSLKCKDDVKKCCALDLNFAFPIYSSVTVDLRLKQHCLI